MIAPSPPLRITRQRRQAREEKRGTEEGFLIPEELFLLLQRVEHVDGGGLLQAVGLEGRQHVDELQEDLADVHGQQVVVALGGEGGGVAAAESRHSLSGATVTLMSWIA